MNFARPLLFGLVCSAVLFSQSSLAIDPALTAALNDEIRSDDDKSRDDSRKPAETLTFFEVNADSKVLEFIPGGGWYTRILGTYLADKGKLYVAIGANPERLKLKESGLTQVNIVGEEIELSPTDQSGIYAANGEVPALAVTGLDVALTFRNLHNLDEATRIAMNKLAYDALKPGGVYGVIDHTRRHMEEFDEDLWRRLDPVQMIKEVQSAGFVFEDYSRVHARPNDKLVHDSTHKSINRDSDRFTLKFRKPK